MDLMKYYVIGHRDHVIYNPFSEAKLDELVALCELPAGARVLDIACGNGELLRRLARRWDASGIGVELLTPFADLARQRTAAAGLADRIEIVEADGAAYQAPPERFDLVSCIGASWIWGGYAGTLKALDAWAKPGGLIIVGEPYFRSEPPQAYLDAQGLAPGVFASHRGNVEIGLDAGFRYLMAIDSNRDDWDRYEGYQSRAIQRYAVECPEDPDVPELLATSRKFRDSYLSWGRDGLGWAVYLFMKPAN